MSIYIQHDTNIQCQLISSNKKKATIEAIILQRQLFLIALKKFV